MIWTEAEVGSLGWLQPRACLERTQAARPHSFLPGYLAVGIVIYLSESEELISVGFILVRTIYLSQDRLWAPSSSLTQGHKLWALISKKKKRLISYLHTSVLRGQKWEITWIDCWLFWFPINNHDSDGQGDKNLGPPVPRGRKWPASLPPPHSLTKPSLAAQRL